MKKNAQQDGTEYIPWKHIHWTANTEYVDIETGEIITKYKAQNEYIKISTAKEYSLDHNKTHGRITYIHLCQRQPQLKLF